MSTPPSGRRHCSPPQHLIDDLIPEILLCLPPDDPACLERASLVCKPWRRILTDPAFLRRYRAFHRTPPMLGFIRNTLKCDDTYTARFVPTASFCPACPKLRGMSALDARHGRVLLKTDSPDEDFAVWDPVTHQLWDVPSLPAASPSWTRYNATVFCAAAGCDHLDCHGGPFAVALVASCGYTHRVIASVYSSEVEEWGELAEIQGVFLFISHLPGVLLGNTVYFTCSPLLMPRIVEYDMGTGKLSVFNLPSLHGHRPSYTNTALTVTEDGRLGFVGVFCSELFLWSWEAGPSGAVAWKHRTKIKLETMDAAPGGDPRHDHQVIGSAASAGVIFVRPRAGEVFSVELKSGQLRETVLPEFSIYDPLFIPYLSFYTPVTGPSSLQIEDAAISDDEFLGDNNNKQVDLGGDVDVQVHHSGDADKQRLMGESVDEQRQVWHAIDKQQKLKNQEERRMKHENKKRKLELEVRRKGLEERRKRSMKIRQSEVIRAEGGGSRSDRKMSQRVIKSPLGRLPLVRSLGVNMLRSPPGVLASAAASKRGRSMSAWDEYPPSGKKAKSSVIRSHVCRDHSLR